MKTRLTILLAVTGAGLALTACGDRDSVEPRATANNNQPAATTDAERRAQNAAADAERRVDAAADSAAKSAKEAWQETKNAAGDLAGDVRQATSETWNKIKDATYDDRANFRSNVNNMADRIDNKLEEWNAKRPSLSESTRRAWDRGVSEVREARAKLNDELDDLADVSSENWNKAKQEVGEAWNNLQAAFGRLEQRMKE